jgi:hypothetical protein
MPPVAAHLADGLGYGEIKRIAFTSRISPVGISVLSTKLYREAAIMIHAT